jgi:uncharacterized DUF497 family protein
VEFEWDPDKAAANLKKHGVEFSEAMTVFGDPLEVTIYRSRSLERAVSVSQPWHVGEGTSSCCRVTEREGRTRIITAREATAQERKQYESSDTAHE